jgi:alditol oxidase
VIGYIRDARPVTERIVPRKAVGYTPRAVWQLRSSMDKRTFLKLCSVSVIGGLLRPAMTSASDSERLENWAGNIQYNTNTLETADSLEQVRAFVRRHEKFKVLGTRHCFNRIADSKNEFLSLQNMDKVVSVDKNNRTVTVAGRVTYGQLCPFLDAQGFALHNLASLPHISVIGACSTATHGSGEKNGNLSTAVSAIEFVNAAGDLIELSQKTDGERFLGSVVALGALGVITKVTLDVRPTYEMRQYVYENLPLGELAKHFDEIETSAYSVSLFTDWQNQRINEVWLKTVVSDRTGFDAPAEFFGAKRATKNLHPIAAFSAENCTEQMGVLGPWYERLPHFRMGFTPSAGKELQSEYFVPRKHAVEAILAIEKLHEQIGPHLLISEIRAIAEDDLWMSPCYRRPSVAIHFTWKPEWESVRKLLPVIEKELAPFELRPHWGKLFTISSPQLRASYKKLPDFIKLCQANDPQGKFRNDFLEQDLFGSA